jgi:Trypsin
MRKRKQVTRRLVCEQLESRCVLSALVGSADELHPVIVAGDPSGSPADSTGNRVDANSPTSPFGGVGSVQISATRGTFICTGTAIDATHVLTAGHCVDLNDDGRSDKKDGIRSITFNVNSDTDLPTDQIDTAIRAASWTTHPDFTGFDRPSVNDDLALITLSTALPAGMPTYALATADMVAGTTHLVMVGYGRSGDGINGYTIGPSWTVKRVGENMVDAFYTQDDIGRPAANEVFRFDFDGQSVAGPLGGVTLPNDKETTLGGGDSGGPSFVLLPGADAKLATSYVLAGVNTFTQGNNAPLFGSMGGGINVYPYESWIQGAIAGSGGSGGGGGSRGHGGAQVASILDVMESSSLVDSHLSGQAWGGTAIVTTAGSLSGGGPVTVSQGSGVALLATHDDAAAGEAQGALESISRGVAGNDLVARRRATSDEAESAEFAAGIDEYFGQGPI